MESEKDEGNTEADNVVEILTAGPKVNNCTFSNDGKLLLIATVCGYQIFSIDDVGECTVEYSTAQRMSITLIQCALSGKLVLFAPTTDASNLYIEDYEKEEVVAKLGYYGPIQDVLANHGTFVVAVNTQIYIYRLAGVQPISQITHILSPFALSNDPINCYLAYCDGNLTGYVVIHDIEQEALVVRILAHRSGSLSCLAMDSAARRLATSSYRGTVIRVFALPTGQLVHQFRRGLTAVLLRCLVFSPDAHCIMTVSERGSVHIFQLKNSSKDQTEGVSADTPSTWRSLLAGVFGNVFQRSFTSLVSTVTGENHLEEERSILTLRTPLTGHSGPQRIVCHYGKYHLNYTLLLCATLGEVYACRVNLLKKSWYAGKSLNLAYVSEERAIHDVLHCDKAEGASANASQRPIPRCLLESPVGHFDDDDLLRFYYSKPS